MLPRRRPTTNPRTSAITTSETIVPTMMNTATPGSVLAALTVRLRGRFSPNAMNPYIPFGEVPGFRADESRTTRRRRAERLRDSIAGVPDRGRVGEEERRRRGPERKLVDLRGRGIGRDHPPLLPDDPERVGDGIVVGERDGDVRVRRHVLERVGSEREAGLGRYLDRRGSVDVHGVGRGTLGRGREESGGPRGEEERDDQERGRRPASSSDAHPTTGPAPDACETGCAVQSPCVRHSNAAAGNGLRPATRFVRGPYVAPYPRSERVGTTAPAARGPRGRSGLPRSRSLESSRRERPRSSSPTRWCGSCWG